MLARVDEEPVWSVGCFVIDRRRRRQGLSVRLLEAAVDYVRSRGGALVEGYPTEPAQGATLPPVFAWTGIASAFRKLGFEEVARRSPTRPILRLRLK